MWKLSKLEILSLPGFNQYRSLTVRQLKSILKQHISDLGIHFCGVLFHHYVKQVEENRKVDDDLFQHMSLMK